jgi:hypothetical protein
MDLMQSKLSAAQGLRLEVQVAPQFGPAYTKDHPREQNGLE